MKKIALTFVSEAYRREGVRSLPRSRLKSNAVRVWCVRVFVCIRVRTCMRAYAWIFVCLCVR